MRSSSGKLAALALALAPVFFFAAPFALGQNTVHTAARQVIPDGTVYTDSTAGTNVTRWYVTTLQAGRSYVAEAMYTNEGYQTNEIWIEPFAMDGASAAVANWVCGSGTGAPGLALATVGGGGARCSIYPYLTTSAIDVKFQVYSQRQHPTPQPGACLDCVFQFRVRETTILTRWSVNGYNMFLALHNADTIANAFGVVLLYPDAPANPADLVTSSSFVVPTQASTQLVYPSLSLNPNHGSAHILATVTDLDVQSYAFSTTANNFNVFAVHRPNRRGGED
jgi:hypothetical protein